MVNKKFWLGVLVMMLVFGITVVSCDEDNDGDEKSDVNKNNDNNSNSLLIGTWQKGQIEFSFTTNGWILSMNGQIQEMGESYSYNGTKLVLTQSGTSISGSATVSGNNLIISGFPNEASMLNGVWTKW
jgi:hypothetical protein